MAVEGDWQRKNGYDIIHTTSTFVLRMCTKGCCKMVEKNIYFLVDSAVLPKVFTDVVEAKKLLQSGKAKTINEAVNRVGISRSAFYKYKDAVFQFTEGSRGKIITIALTLDHTPGVLSNVLNVIAKMGANVLTINQNIPIHGIANVTMAVDTKQLKAESDRLISELEGLHGVEKIELLAEE